MNRIVIFRGARKDFLTYLETQKNDFDDSLKFMELIQQYNELIRASNAGYINAQTMLAKEDKEYVENCIIHADDYGSVLEHVVSNFTQIITAAHDIKNLFLHNPPKRVIESLETQYVDIIENEYTEYKRVEKNELKKLHEVLNKSLVGQIEAKKQILTGFYRLSNEKEKPIVLLFKGPSGVGKTESAKIISNFLGGNLLRVQFSMMQTMEAYNYIFGDKHSKASFARDLLQRESNIVLLDEFDKVSPELYNAFYEVFGEGRFSDLNYTVDVSNCIFILTTNFSNEKEMVEKLGMPIYSRISSTIDFYELSLDETEDIINNIYQKVIDNLTEDDRNYVSSINLKQFFISNAKSFDNIRLLESRIKDAVYSSLTAKLLYD